jgi:hypothetical protein
MERILALQNMSHISAEDMYLNSTNSVNCSSDSNNGCSSESVKCHPPATGGGGGGDTLGW